MSLSNIRQILSTNEIELFQRKSVPPCLGYRISREVGMKNIRGYPGGQKKHADIQEDQLLKKGISSTAEVRIYSGKARFNALCELCTLLTFT